MTDNHYSNGPVRVGSLNDYQQLGPDYLLPGYGCHFVANEVL